MPETISVVVAPTDPGKGIFGSGPLISVDIPVERLKANLTDLVTKLRTATTGASSPKRMVLH